ncbi:MFS transporter [Roseivivax sediminis]|uniref:Predicted arabinose efflux permease, MFS family n=1 Tax=Roseivivax sediminis TaxID=936889 RepID=A0A1I1VKG1_9RHOB|nr:MFS transporter [Roseivivax sediminis]SFD83411.1 Predicted arabinose efflux permease, MFS family [Roseivivax sediminis]
MTRTLITLSALLAGYFMLQMSNGLQGSLLAVRADLEGFGATVAGLVMSGFFVGMGIGSLLAGRMIERVGHVRTFAALASVASAAALVHLVVIQPVVWIAVRAITGFCFAGLLVVVESWLNASVASRERGRLLSIYAMVGMAAGAVGQLLLDAADPAGFMLFVLVSIGLSLALVPSTLSRATAPVPDVAQERPSVGQLWQISPFGAVAMAMAGATIGTFFGLAPVFAQRIGFTPSDIAYLMAAATLGGMALQFPVGALSDRLDRRWVCIGLALTAAATMALLGLSTAPAFGPGLAIAALMGGVLLPTTSVVVAHINDRAPPEALLAASGGIVLMQGIGAALGPFLGGAAMDTIGPRGFLLTLSAVQAVIVVFALVRIVLNHNIEPDRKTPYAPVPMTQVEGELHMPEHEDAPAPA